MLDIAICDDDLAFIDLFENQLSHCLNKHCLDYRIAKFHKLSNLFDNLYEGVYYDVIFLDIEFDQEDKNGVDLSRYLRDNLNIDSTSLVFISSKRSYALSLFESQPLDFLIKPIDDARLEGVLLRFLRIKNIMSKTFVIKERGNEIKIPLSSILYFQSFNHKIIVTCLNDIRYEYSDKLSSIICQLSSSNFFTPHKSYFVNYYAVKKWGSRQLTMLDNTTIPISRSHKEDVQRVQLDSEVHL